MAAQPERFTPQEQSSGKEQVLSSDTMLVETLVSLLGPRCF